MRIGYIVGDKIDWIYQPIGVMVELIIKISVVVGVLSVPCAAIKYLFFQ